MNREKIEQNRPTSPHIQIYGWNISSLTSIMHRASGVAMYISVVILSWYIVLFTYNYKDGSVSLCECKWWGYFENITVGAVLVIVLALSYHICNGVRHLFWDIGKGFNINTAKKTGYTVLVVAFTIAAVVLYNLISNKFL